MTEIGELLGTEQEAASARSKFENGISQIAGSDQKVVVLNGLEVLYSFGANSYVNELVVAAGGRLATDDLDGNAIVLSDEYMIAQNPDYIILASGDEMSVSDLLRERPSWRGIKALKEGKFYTLDPDILLRPSPRITQAVDSLRTWLKDDVQGK